MNSNSIIGRLHDIQQYMLCFDSYATSIAFVKTP